MGYSKVILLQPRLLFIYLPSLLSLPFSPPHPPPPSFHLLDSSMTPYMDCYTVQQSMDARFSGKPDLLASANAYA